MAVLIRIFPLDSSIRSYLVDRRGDGQKIKEAPKEKLNNTSHARYQRGKEQPKQKRCKIEVTMRWNEIEQWINEV